MLMSLALLNHYSSARTNLHVRDELDNHDVHQHKFQKPPPTAHDPESILTDALSPESSLGNDIPTAQVSSTPIVANATLDFGKIYVLNLETREDRRDDMTLIAAASGLQLSFVAGVNSKTLDEQSLPDIYGTEEFYMESTHLACYRGHANIWRKIIEDGVETALIMEDDIDWDLNIREIIPRVKEAMTQITKEKNQFSNTPGINHISL